MLTLQFIPYHEILNLDSDQRIRKILTSSKQDKIVLIGGRLKKEEEAKLIEKTMESINGSFKGIELAVINPNLKSLKTNFTYGNLKKHISNLFLGHRAGLTIIGPATVVKEIKRDPNKIELFTKNGRNKNRRISRT